MIKRDPYWWVEAPLAQTVPKPVDASCDVVIMGAGYTGLSAAITLARAGRSVQVFDRQKPGEGASSRNGGITSGNLRPSFAEMTKRFGEARATAILAEAKLAREDLYRFLAEENIDCDFKLVGRFVMTRSFSVRWRRADRFRRCPPGAGPFRRVNVGPRHRGCFSLCMNRGGIGGDRFPGVSAL